MQRFKSFIENRMELDSKLRWKYYNFCFVLIFLLQTSPEKAFATTRATLIIIDDNMFATKVAKEAIDTINSNENILPNITLNLFQQVSLNGAGYKIRDFFLSLGNATNVIAVFGPQASGTIPTINKIAVRNSLLQVNYNALDDTFSNSKLYPYLFNTCQLYSIYEASLTEILLHYNWKKLGLVYVFPNTLVKSIFYEAAQKFERQLQMKGISDISVQSVSYTLSKLDSAESKAMKEKEHRQKLKVLKNKDVRIIIVFMDIIPFRIFLCEAFYLGMYGPKYVYINFYSHGFENWYHHQHETRCKDQDLLRVSESVLFLDRSSVVDDNLQTVSNKTVGEIWKNIRLYPNQERRHLYLYDGIWAYALSLHKVLQQEPSYADDINNIGENRTRLDILAKQFEKLDFQGTTGRFKYIMSNGRRYRSGDILLKEYHYQYNNKTRRVTPKFHILGKVGVSGIHLSNVSKLRKYGIPLDRPRLIRYVLKYPNVLITLIWVMCGCGISIASLFFLTNIVYRNLTFIKLSSPNINSLICIGCIVLYAAVILYGLDTKTVNMERIASICNATVLLLCMGFTLTFGALFSKTWRIYRIFTRSQSLRSAVIKDIHLISIVLALLLVDLIIFFAWLGVSPYQLKEHVIDRIENRTADTVEEAIYHRCESKHQSVFLAIIFAYKGLLMLFGLFVAFETRHIVIEAINDAKYIGFAVYNSVLFIIFSSILVYGFYNTNKYQAVYGIFAFGIFEVTTMTMLLVFIPKINMIIHEDYDDPNFKNGRPVLFNDASKSDYSDSYAGTKTSAVK